MAEWSKALRSGRSIFGCVGSNPTPVNFRLLMHDFVATLRETHSDFIPKTICYGRMAEWSKALRSGRSIFGCVGSNPTPVNFLLLMHDFVATLRETHSGFLPKTICNGRMAEWSKALR